MSFTHGIKGSDVHVTTGSTVLDLSVMLNRGLPATTIATELAKVFASGSAEDKVDAFVLAYQTRDVRGGKGERDLFYHFYSALSSLHPDALKATLSLIPEYGCWRDVFKVMPTAFNKELTDLVLSQLQKDDATPPDQTISLLAKHAPREHNTKDKSLAASLSRQLYPGDNKAQMKWRKLLSSLNKRLQTVEVAMCAKNFASIDPAKVPGRALKLYTKGFLNQPVKGKHGRKVPSEDLDRITAAQHFTDHFALAAQGKAKVNGANTVYPHELVAKVLANFGSTYPPDVEAQKADRDAVEAQWLSIVKPIKALGTLGRTLPMCDFSGSMSGDPMNVSMALGLLIAECNTGVFKDHMLTFDSTPKLHKFSATTFVDRVNEVRHLAQGLSTDFQAAYNLVLNTMKTFGVAPGMEPKDLIVLTDMGWDAACGANQRSAYTQNKYMEAVKTKATETHPQIARRAFQLAGEQLFGAGNGWQSPRIVIWNLRAEFKDFHATSTEEGVVQVSGWSPSLLKVLMTKGADALTPQAMLRAQLDDERYDPVRTAVTPVLVRS
jgi:hypothetical protein